MNLPQDYWSHPYPWTLSEIKEIIERVVTPFRYREILWIGVAGSFARALGEQDPRSTVRLIVGFPADGGNYQERATKNLRIELERLSPRKFHVVHLRDLAIPTSAQARRQFWHSVTVFVRAGGEQWFERNRSRVFDVERHFFWSDEERAPSPEIAELTEMFDALGH